MGVPWPVGVPDCFQVDTYEERAPENTIFEQFEEGPPQTRQLATSNAVPVNFGFLFTTSEKNLFKTWYESSLGYGALKYETIDYANDEQLHNYKFSSVPVYKPIGGENWRVTWTAVRLD